MKIALRAGAMFLATTLAVCGCKKKQEQAEAVPAPSPTGIELIEPVSLPEDIFGLAYCDNPTAFVADIEKVLSATGMVMPGMFGMQLNRLLLEIGLSKIQTVDLSRPVAILLLNPKEFADPVVLRLSLSGKDDFLSALSPAWKKGEEKEGVVEMNSGAVDTYAVFKGTGAEGEVPHKQEKLYVRVSDGQAWIGASRAAVVNGAKASFSLPLKGRGLVLHARLDRLRRLFSQEIRSSAEEIRRTMTGLLQDSGLGSPAVLFLYGWMIDKMVSTFEQIREAQVVLGANDGALFLRAGLWCEPDSFFSRMLAAQKRDSAQRLYTLLPAEGFLAMGMNVQWDILKADMAEFSDQILSALFGKTAGAEWTAVIKDMLDAIGDEIAAVEDISPTGFALDELVSIKDEAKAKAAVAKMLKLLANASPQMQLPGLKYQVSLSNETIEHQGVALSGFEFAIDNSGMAPGEAEVFRRLYGERMRFVYGFFDGMMLMSMGKDPVARAKAMIDRARRKDAGIASAPYFQAAAGGMDRRSGAFLFMSISGMLDNTMSLVAPAPSGREKAPAKMQSGMFWAFDSTPARLTMTVRLPADHLKEIGNALRAVTQAQGSAPATP
jgi:hypothetical protein